MHHWRKVSIDSKEYVIESRRLVVYNDYVSLWRDEFHSEHTSLRGKGVQFGVSKRLSSVHKGIQYFNYSKDYFSGG